MASKILLKTSVNRSKLAWALAGGVGALLALLLTNGTGPADPSHLPAATSQANSNDLARTFIGTTPDGVLANQGQDLVLSPDLIRRFEYHLTAVGERSLAQIREAIVKDITAELNEKGQKEALRILDAYLKFKTALGSVNQPKMTGSVAQLWPATSGRSAICAPCTFSPAKSRRCLATLMSTMTTRPRSWPSSRTSHCHRQTAKHNLST